MKLNTETLRVTIEQIQNKALVVHNMLHFVTFFTEKSCMFANNLLIRLASLLNFSDEAVFGKLSVAMLHIVKINQYQLPEQRMFYAKIAAAIPENQRPLFDDIRCEDGRSMSYFLSNDVAEIARVIM
jgi:hypothetical protein